MRSFLHISTDYLVFSLHYHHRLSFGILSKLPTKWPIMSRVGRCWPLLTLCYWDCRDVCTAVCMRGWRCLDARTRWARTPKHPSSLPMSPTTCSTWATFLRCTSRFGQRPTAARNASAAAASWLSSPTRSPPSTCRNSLKTDAVFFVCCWLIAVHA